MLPKQLLAHTALFDVNVKCLVLLFSSCTHSCPPPATSIGAFSLFGSLPLPCTSRCPRGGPEGEETPTVRRGRAQEPSRGQSQAPRSGIPGVWLRKQCLENPALWEQRTVSCSGSQMFLEPPGKLVKNVNCYHRDSDALELGWRLGICVSRSWQVIVMPVKFRLMH